MDEELKAFEWERLFVGLPDELYYLEVILRVIIVFLFITVVLRIIGRRGQKTITPVKQVIIISLGTTIGDAMLYPQVPLFYTLTILLVLLTCMFFITKLKFHNNKIEKFVSAGPLIIVKNGSICEENIKKEKLTNSEIYAMLRCSGVRYIEKVDMAILETTGDISVFKNDNEIPKNTTSLLDEAEEGI